MTISHRASKDAKTPVKSRVLARAKGRKQLVFKAAFAKYYESAFVLNVAQKDEKSGKKRRFSRQNEEKSEKFCEKMKKSKKIKEKNNTIKEGSNVGESMLVCLKKNEKRMILK